MTAGSHFWTLSHDLEMLQQVSGFAGGQVGESFGRCWNSGGTYTRIMCKEELVVKMLGFIGTVLAISRD